MDSPIEVDQGEFRRLRWTGVKWTSLMAVVDVAAAALLQFVLFGVASRSLSSERFGVWTAVATLSLLLSLTDFGLNKAAINLIASSPGSRDSGVMKRIVSTAFFSQGAICLVVAVVLVPLVGLISWADVFHLQAADPQVPRAIQMVIILSLATAPFNVARSALVGIHRGWVSLAWDLAGSMAGTVAALSIGIDGSLIWMAAISSVAPVVGRLLCAIWLLARLTPGWRSIDRQTAADLRRSGKRFFVAQSSELVFQQSQPWLVSQYIGSALAGGFLGAARLVKIPYFIASATANSLIPAYADAHARRDWPWIRSTLAESAAGAVVLSVAFAAVFYALLDPLLHAWLGSAIALPRPSTRLWLAGAAVVQTLSAPMWALLYGLGRVSLPARLSSFSSGAWLTAGSLGGWLFGELGLAMALCLIPFLCQLLPLTWAAWRCCEDES